MAWAVLMLLATAAAAPKLDDLTRRDNGDSFTLIGETCSTEQCHQRDAVLEDNVPTTAASGCACACTQRAPLFREDLERCVQALPECSLATFGTGNGVQRIPFVYLPLRGQIIHPSKEIIFQDVKTPICAVSGAQFLTRKGFVDLRNTLDADVPFSLFRDEGRTFLQWSGEDDLRVRMSGRVMVVRLLCRDITATPMSPLDLRGVFTPCVAFRVQGSPPKHITNVTEVQFAPNAQTSDTSTSGLSIAEYVAIGISSLLLGLIYVASVFLYLHLRKRRKSLSEGSSTKRIKSLKKKDGSAITEHDIVRISSDRVQTVKSAMEKNDGVVKKNPLLAINRQFHEVKNNYPNDSGSNISDSEDFPDSCVRNEDNRFNGHTTSVVIHPYNRDLKMREEGFSEMVHRDEPSIERLPDEHVSIVETIDDREIARPVGNTRRKLYFNPAYFEPHLMAEPPATALEFLVKIREVIAIAKHKMASKRFQPVLNEIPEEDSYPSNGNSIDLYQVLGSQKSGSLISLKRENSRKKAVNCVGCPGCKSDASNDIQNLLKFDVPACSNCLSNKGEKQNSIRKWLANIPTSRTSSLYNEILPNGNHNIGLVNSLKSLPTSENSCKVRKQSSFSISKQSMRSIDGFSMSKRSSTMSVRSEPPIRSYNLPLPEFEQIKTIHSHACYGQTISRVEDIRPIGLNEFRQGSSRRQSTSSLRGHRFIGKNVLPDMINEAIALEHCSKSYQQSSSEDERPYNQIPKNIQPFVSSNNDISAGDYESDSLERSNNKKGITSPTDFIDLPSSQASPSLSNALPLEEELTMRNEVYKTNPNSSRNTPSPYGEPKTNQNHYEMIGENKIIDNKTPAEVRSKNNDYSLVSEVYVNSNYNFGSSPTSPSSSECSIGSRKLKFKPKHIEDEKPGSLMIEVKDSPENYIKIHESDGFEPDTLDRKHAKQKVIVETVQFSRKDLIKQLNADDRIPASERTQLSSKGQRSCEDSSKFNSLRHVYEHHVERPMISSEIFSGSKSLEEKIDDSWEETPADWITEEGRILTLELRHSKRQRQSTPPTIKQLKNLARPDVLPPLPPTDHPIYEQPAFPPRRVEADRTIDNHSKNVNGRSLSPRIIIKNPTAETSQKTMPRLPRLHVGSSCSHVASAKIHNSDYENINASSDVSKTGDSSRTSYRKRSARSSSVNAINTNTFVKSHKEELSKPRFRRKKGTTVEDSGYLSSDSTSSRQVQRKLVIPKLVSCSESDDTENEARSESGAESVETHSVFFGSLRKHETNNFYDRSKRELRDSRKKYRQSK